MDFQQREYVEHQHNLCEEIKRLKGTLVRGMDAWVRLGFKFVSGVGY